MAPMRQDGGVHAPNPTPTDTIPEILAAAVDLARSALAELGDGAVGEHLGMTVESAETVTHRFAADLPGYRGWEWVAVLAFVPGAGDPTVSEIALVPGAGALVAPAWVPWEDRVRPGDLAPGLLLPPPADDPRIVPGYTATGDPVIDDTAVELGLGRRSVMSREGRLEAAGRWAAGENGPGGALARAAEHPCGTCAFYLPLAGALSAAFGACGNEFAVDGHVVHAEHGCGAHSDTPAVEGRSARSGEAWDDAEVEVVVEDTTS